MIIQPIFNTTAKRPMTPASQAPDISGTPGTSGICELTHLGVIRVAGVDALTFLQGQLTQDVALLGLSEARLAAYCNAKGRMQASFVLFKRSHEEVLMVCSRDILAATLKRLSMFVMRAKAKLSDASADFVLCGVSGSAIKLIADGASTAWTKADIGDANLVFLQPGAGQSRALWCAPGGAALPLPEGPHIDLALWQWLEVQSGIAMITQPIFEAFVPQMLNYESVGGVSFKKGCYPGQEIVARSQFRGTLKRRAYLVHADAAPSVGQEVFHAPDAEQPCGLVAAAAASPSGGFDAIVSMQISAASDGGLTLGSATGAALTLLPLPYPLLEDI
jgi:folate-binding protein YgfZ